MSLPSFSAGGPHFRRNAFFLGALMGVLALTGCRTTPPLDGIARASASVRVEDTTDPSTSIGEEAVHFNRLQAQSFEGFGAGKYPADASGSAQGQAYARAEARRAALRALADQIVAFGADGKSTLVEVLGNTEDWRSVLEQSLEKRAQVEFKTREGVEMARARIRGDNIFRGPAPPGSAGRKQDDLGDNELQLIARRRKAETLATEAAREFLYEDLLPLGSRTSLFGVRRGPSETFKKALREELENVPALTVEFTDNGQCVVHMEYDRSGLAHLSH